MATAAAAATADAAPKKGSKKKLLIIVGAVLVLVLAGGGAALFMMKKASDKAAAEAAEAEGGEAEAAPKAKAKIDPKTPPTFVPLDPFVVNLADRDSDRFAQVGITLQIDAPEFAEKMKPFMPAIRNNILMLLANKTAGELLTQEGKEKLAEAIAREAVRPMGIEIDPPEAEEAEDTSKKRKRRPPPPHNPVQQVLFSSFIVQ